MFFVILIVSILSIICRADEYCATISPSEADGASGYFAMKISDGIAYYGFSLDLTEFTDLGTCLLSTYGLKYHIHSYWNGHSTESAGGPISCNSSYAGGHYDPNLACSSTSQSINTECTSLKRTSTYGYTYTCNTAVYNAGNYSSCEVGDLSGKFGVAYNYSGSYMFSEGIFVDYYPPLNSNFKKTLTNSIMWSSIVFHCGTNSAPRILCADFSTTTTSACQSSFSEMDALISSSEDDDDSNNLSSGAIAGISVACFIIGVVLAVVVTTYVCIYRQKEPLSRQQNSVNL